MKKSKYIGSSFDDFLEEEGIFAEVKTEAIKEVLALQIQQMMKEKGYSKTAMAEKMKTSRSSLNNLLEPRKSVTIKTLAGAANALGKKIEINLVPA